MTETQQSQEARIYPPSDKPAYASVWQRFQAHMIDAALLLIAFVISGALIGHAMGVERDGLSIIWPLFPWPYYALCESSMWQGTVGKRALNIKVVDEEGNPLTFGKASARYFIKFFSVTIFGIGCLVAGITPKKQSIHDLAVKTIVVCK